MEIVKELLPYLYDTIVGLLAIIAFLKKGKTKKTKSVEEIKATADKKYSAYVEKQCKKNKIENVLIETSNLDETEV